MCRSRHLDTQPTQELYPSLCNMGYSYKKFFHLSIWLLFQSIKYYEKQANYYFSYTKYYFCLILFFLLNYFIEKKGVKFVRL